MSGHPSEEAWRPLRLSEQFKELRIRVAKSETGMSVLELEQALRGRGIVVLVLLMALPFAFPVTIPGLSTPFGIAICMVGVRLSLGHRPWMPGYVTRMRIPQQRLEKLLGLGERAAIRVERVVRPRFVRAWEWQGTDRLLWASIAVSAATLCLPLPIPFSNTLPGLAIVLIAIGIMERDGLAALAGGGALLFAFGYFGALIFFGKLGVSEFLKHG